MAQPPCVPNVPPLPADIDPDRLFAGIAWHQRWEVFHNVFTPGRNPVCWLLDEVDFPRDLSGLRVLDIGAWHGCFSFECERRGAAEVVALSLEDPEAVGFHRLKNCLGSRVVRYEQQSIYTADRELLGEFDIILFMGVLYHLRYPLLAIDRMRTLCRGTVYLESHVIDENFPIAGWWGTKASTLKKVHRGLPGIPLWRFYKDRELGDDKSNWFGPNVQAVLEAFESAGFAIRLVKQWGDRAGFQATVGPELGHVLGQTYEALADNRRLLGLE
jgi:tRNA (mo5U34)-methyltransferase